MAISDEKPAEGQAASATGRSLPTLRQVWDFIRLTRVVFLLGGVVQYALGAAVALWLGADFRLWPYLVGQAAVTSIQLMAHYRNEYDDLEVDRLAGENRTWFSGGSGILAVGGVSPQAVLTAARVCAAAAVVFGLAAAALNPWMAVVILLSFFGSWFYSAPPVALMASGWGETTTTLLVAGLVPAAGSLLQGGGLNAALVLATLPLMLVHLAMLIAFEIPDRETDRVVGKNTLTVRLGYRGTTWVHNLAIGLGFALLALLAVRTDLPVRWALLSAPLALWQMVQMLRTVRKQTRTNFHQLTTGAIGLFALAAGLVFLGFGWEVLQRSW
jgi:1,4-dihydroxy-2-naphthoate octaprenyltransferase